MTKKGTLRALPPEGGWAESLDFNSKFWAHPSAYFRSPACFHTREIARINALHRDPLNRRLESQCHERAIGTLLGLIRTVLSYRIVQKAHCALQLGRIFCDPVVHPDAFDRR